MGRPPGMSFSRLYQEIGDEPIDGRDPIAKKLGIKSRDRMRWREIVARQAYRFAASGSKPHLQEIAEREEGKVAQPLKHELGEVGKELSQLIAKMGLDENSPIVKALMMKFEREKKS